MQLAGQITDFILTGDRRRVRIRFAQPHPQLQQGRGDVATQAQAQCQGQSQQNGAKNAHALQADGHRLFELVHVQADTQVPGRHILEGDLGLVHTLGFTQQAVFRTLPGLGEDAVIDAIDSRVRHQGIFGQVVEQHVEAEDVVGHQQLGGRRGSLRGQALTQRIGLVVHGLLELQAHDHGINDQRQRDQNHVVGGNAQSYRNATIA